MENQTLPTPSIIVSLDLMIDLIHECNFSPSWFTSVPTGYLITGAGIAKYVKLTS
jgi:hypothetical protein